MGPSSRRLAVPRGQRAWVGRAAATNTCQNVFLWQGHLLRWAAEPVLHTEGLHSFFGVFSASALLTRPSPLPLLWGAVFLLPYFHSPPGTFKPQSHWLLVLEHALHFSSTHPAPNDPSTSSCPNHLCQAPSHFQEVSRHCTSHPYPCLFLPTSSCVML